MNDDTPIPPEGVDPLDALLRESTAYIPDNGFTARVLTSLPPRRPVDHLRLAFFAAAWLAGAVILVLRAPTVWGFASAFLAGLHQGQLPSLLALVPALFGLGCLVWALASWALEEWG